VRDAKSKRTRFSNTWIPKWNNAFDSQFVHLNSSHDLHLERWRGKVLRNDGILPHPYTTSQPARPLLTSSPSLKLQISHVCAQFVRLPFLVNRLTASKIYTTHVISKKVFSFYFKNPRSGNNMFSNTEFSLKNCSKRFTFTEHGGYSPPPQNLFRFQYYPDIYDFSLPSSGKNGAYIW
jgi:hypothetical protein